MRAPSEFSRTVGSPPSMTDMQELVVPRSIPKILAIIFSFSKGVNELVCQPIGISRASSINP